MHMSVTLDRMHRDGGSLSGSMDVHVCLHCAFMWEFGQFNLL